MASLLHSRSGAALVCLQLIHVLRGSAWRCAEELRELRKREKEQGIHSNWEIDSFMAADTLEGKREAIVTEYMLRILGLDVSRSGMSCLSVRIGRPGYIGKTARCSLLSHARLPVTRISICAFFWVWQGMCDVHL